MSRKKVKHPVLTNITIEDYAAEGKSIAKVDGKAVFIEGAVPGDVVDVRLSKNKKNWAEGTAIQIHTFSATRTAPFCDHFGLCGGCKWQMLPYQQQLKYKQNEVEQNLKRLGGIELPDLLPISGSNKTRLYRNKLEFTFSSKRYRSFEELQDKDTVWQDEPALGFHVPRLFDKIIDIHHCHLMDEPTNAIRNLLRTYALQHQLSFYDIKNHTGWLRTLIIRVATTGEVMVNLCIAYEDEPARVQLLDYLLQQVPSITTLLYTINPKKNDSIFDLEPKAYYGKGYIIEKLGQYQFKVGPKSFFQTNTEQAEQLYSITKSFAELTGKETVYDLYCGTGSIGIFVSDGAKRVVGVEVVADAIEDAKENARLNNVQDAHFFAGDVIDICDDAFFDMHGKPDVIITDPPRAGMHEKLVRKILDMEAPVVVYVSCNSATQARDLGILNEKYIVTKVQPVDMFPHTHHIENVVQLKLRP